MKTETQLVTLFSRAAKRLGIEPGDIEVQGEKLRSKLGLKHHLVFLVTRDESSISNPFPMSKIEKITGVLRNTIVYQDLPRRDNKRNLTLTTNTNLTEDQPTKKIPFIFIQPLPEGQLSSWTDIDGNVVNNSKQIEEFKKAREEERAWIFRMIEPKLYSSIEQSTPDSTLNTYTWQEKEEVSIPVRIVTNNKTLVPSNLTYLRSTKSIASSKTFIYFVVDQLSEVERGLPLDVAEKLHILAHLLDKTPIVVSKSKVKYLNEIKNLEYSNTLFQTVISKSSSQRELTELVSYNSKVNVLDTIEYKNLKKFFPELLTKELRTLSSDSSYTVGPSSSSILRHVPDLPTIDKKEEFDKFLNSIYSKYPLLDFVNVLSRYYISDTDPRIQSLRKYIKLINTSRRVEVKPTRVHLKLTPKKN